MELGIWVLAMRKIVKGHALLNIGEPPLQINLCSSFTAMVRRKTGILDLSLSN